MFREKLSKNSDRRGGGRKWGDKRISNSGSKGYENDKGRGGAKTESRQRAVPLRAIAAIVGQEEGGREGGIEAGDIGQLSRCISISPPR